MIPASVIAALWLTVKLPFIFVINGERLVITHNEMQRFHGGWTKEMKCNHCDGVNVISFDFTDVRFVNLEDLYSILSHFRNATKKVITNR